jgi:hypothetical protein
MRWLIGLLVLLAALFLIGYFRIDGGVMMPGQNVLDSALQWVVHAVGSAVAGVAAILLLVRAVQNQPAESVVSLVLPLFAGVLLLHPDWSTAVALAAVAVSLILRDTLGRRPPRESQDPF